MQVAKFNVALLAEDEATARAVLSNCVHCGMCNATCPTYQLAGNELDGPRGRIYLMKQMFEDGKASAITQHHLNRCLSCQSCESTCPSGVQYTKLLEVGQHYLHRNLQLPLKERLLRAALLRLVPDPRAFGPLLRLGQAFRAYLPKAWRTGIPVKQKRKPKETAAKYTRRVVLHSGCVQSVATPNTNESASNILARLGVGAHATRPGCCGALHWHLHERGKGLELIKGNVRLWADELEAGAEAFVATASGCDAFIKNYGRILAKDPVYSERAQRVSAACVDFSSYLYDNQLYEGLARSEQAVRVAVHNPCSLRHGQGSVDTLAKLLTSLGFQVLPVAEAHICCGSAGSYSILQKDIAQRLRADKLACLCATQPEAVVTANVGCQLHLYDDEQPVLHWLDLVAEHCAAKAKAAAA